jgi:hypothetical protein
MGNIAGTYPGRWWAAKSKPRGNFFFLSDSCWLWTSVKPHTRFPASTKGWYCTREAPALSRVCCSVTSAKLHRTVAQAVAGNGASPFWLSSSLAVPEGPKDWLGCLPFRSALTHSGVAGVPDHQVPVPPTPLSKRDDVPGAAHSHTVPSRTVPKSLIEGTDSRPTVLRIPHVLVWPPLASAPCKRLKSLLLRRKFTTAQTSLGLLPEINGPAMLRFRCGRVWSSFDLSSVSPRGGCDERRADGHGRGVSPGQDVTSSLHLS